MAKNSTAPNITAMSSGKGVSRYAIAAALAAITAMAV